MGDDGRVAADRSLRDRLLAAFEWRGDRTDPDLRADLTGWWRDPVLLRDIATTRR